MQQDSVANATDGARRMDFIFMLTHHDRTVPNCLDVLAEVAGLGLGHIGFKDVGADTDTLQVLARRIKANGAAAYVEVVSTTPETIRQSIRTAAELGVDHVLGGQELTFALESLNGDARYYPFPGRPEGHPTNLGGRPGEIERDCDRAMAAGCAGVDLLAFRAIEAEPLDLIRAARRGLGRQGHLIVAGSISSPERIRTVADAGADAFTIGTAIFEETFAPGLKGVRAQCEAVLAAMAL
jgi:hypothetical protein